MAGYVKREVLRACTKISVEVAAPERFVARDRFVLGRDAELAISYLGEDFTSHFLGLVEDNAGPATLEQRILIKSSIDGTAYSKLLTPAGGRLPVYARQLPLSESMFE